MAYGIINTENLTDIADAIRAKLGVQTTYKPGQIASAIESISGGGITPTGTKSITENGILYVDRNITSYRFVYNLHSRIGRVAISLCKIISYWTKSIKFDM